MRRDDKSLSVLVCRGCCCGSYAKHPDVDHARHLSSLTSAMAGVPGAKVWAVDCLDSCERSNVVVVRTNGQRRWFGEMLADADVEILADWLRSGAPGETPTDLLPHIFDPDSLTPATPPMAPLKEGELVDWIVGAIVVGGGWTVGCRTAVGEFDSTGASVVVERTDDGSGGTITARTSTGEMRLRISSDTRAFFVGGDRPAAEPVLVVLASVAAGEPPRPEANIVHSTLGSIEVFTTPAARQPSAHIHPIPDPDIDEGGERLPFGIVLPKGFTPGAVHFRRLSPR